MGAGVPSKKHAQRVLDRLEEDLRDAARRRGAEGVADEPGILDSGEHLDVAEPRSQRSTLAEERLRVSAVVLAVEQRPGATQEIVELVDVSRHRAQGRLDLLDGAEIEQLAQLLHAHQLAEEVAI